MLRLTGEHHFFKKDETKASVAFSKYNSGLFPFYIEKFCSCQQNENKLLAIST
jgi:hypothetical protein